MTDQIHVDITIYNQIELLRQEIDRREEEFKSIESSIRAVLFELEKVRYLQSLDAFYHDPNNVSYPDNYESFPDMEQRRIDLFRVIATLKQQLNAAIQQTGMPRPAPAAASEPTARASSASSASGGPKRGFDDFDSFRRRRGK